MFTPARRRGKEILDDPSTDSALAIRSLQDVARANHLFGGRRAILNALDLVLRDKPQHVTLLDIGTGLGDIPKAAERKLGSRNIRLTTIGLDIDVALVGAAARSCTHVLAGSAFALPMRDHSIDVVTCSQVLHHFEEGQAVELLRECTRVARRAVIVGDLRRSWLAVAGLWTASFALGFHPVSRHDGMVSILRGFTSDDLRRLVRAATGQDACITRQPGWRITATWTPRENGVMVS